MSDSENAVKIIDSITEIQSKVWVSIEFFPPKTEAGVNALYLVVDKIKKSCASKNSEYPLFVDITWVCHNYIFFLYYITSIKYHIVLLHCSTKITSIIFLKNKLIFFT